MWFLYCPRTKCFKNSFLFFSLTMIFKEKHFWQECHERGALGRLHKLPKNFGMEGFIPCPQVRRRLPIKHKFLHYTQVIHEEKIFGIICVGNHKIQTLGRLTAKHVVRLSLCCSVNTARDERARWENSISVSVNVSSEALQKEGPHQEWEGGRHHMLGRKRCKIRMQGNPLMRKR